MENIEFDNIISDYKKAEMVVIGLGNQMCEKAFDDVDKKSILDFYKGVLDKKNFFIITSHQNSIFAESDINQKRICNPLINDEINQKQWDFYNKWLYASLNKNLLILEIGEDFNHPNIFRWPFEKVVFINQKAKMYRISDLFYQLPADIGDRAKSVKINGMSFVCDLMDYIV